MPFGFVTHAVSQSRQNLVHILTYSLKILNYIIGICLDYKIIVSTIFILNIVFVNSSICKLRFFFLSFGFSVVYICLIFFLLCVFLPSTLSLIVKYFAPMWIRIKNLLYVQEVVTPFYIVSYYIKWGTSSWTYSIFKVGIHSAFLNFLCFFFQ